ncbi:RagB/SusD family nutrient uptake outer membrane protein [Dyadobacter sp. UC 10]|nr:RagB/SusD family nutrient uptake outer membrane protein [Dyadobacter sp. UC 10]
MKNLKYHKWLAALLLMLGATGCNDDLLTTVPNDRLSSDIFWKTEKDAIFAANAVYTYLDSTNIFYYDGMSDIGHNNSVTSQEAMIERGQYDPTFTRIGSEWVFSYAGIRAANIYLEKVDEVQTNNPAVVTRLKAEVRVLRAYLYIKLAALYGDVPLVEKSISLSESRSISRTPAGQIWDFVYKELTESAAALPEVQAEKGRITKGAALALNARAMLYAGRYDLAAQESKKVIDLGIYKIYPSYEKLFTYAGEGNEEVILDKQYVKNNYSNSVFQLFGPWSQRNSNSAVVPTRALIDAYPMANGKKITDPASGYNAAEPYKNRDPRLGFSIFVKGDKLPDGTIYNSDPGNGTADAVDFSWFATSTGYNFQKYITPEDLPQPTNSGLNIILLRYADVLLMYAEAKVELNTIDQSVYDAINQVRQRADVALPAITGTLSQGDLREVIRNERKLELAFEGLRYFDIRRWKLSETLVPGRVYGISYLKNGSPAMIEVPAFEKAFNKNRDYLWPIPQREIELNNSLSQNLNW